MSEEMIKFQEISNRMRVASLESGQKAICDWISHQVYGGPGALGSIPQARSLYELRTGPIDHIATVLSKLNVTHAVIQETVLDSDFFDEYITYYSRQFEVLPADCRRVHFFKLSQSTPVTESDAVGFIDAASVAAASAPDIYLGFITLRPLITAPIAASILRPPQNIGWITVNGQFPVHIAGRKFVVDGTPYMQQDSAVTACGQASIWMSLRTIRKRDGHRAYSPGQISSASFKGVIVGRTLPNRGEGVTVFHILEAIRTAGYSTPVINLRPAETRIEGEKTTKTDEEMADELFRAKLKIYRYVEANIPVILILETQKVGVGHAVVVVGHGLIDKTKKLADCPKFFSSELRVKQPGNTAEKKVRVFPSAFYCDSFIVQNDAEGPYQLLPIDKSQIFGGDPLYGKTYNLAMATQAIPILPADVFMDADEASEVAQKLLATFLPIEVSFHDEINYVVERPYLMEKHQFREWAANSTLSQELSKIYRSIALPKRLWLIELSCKKDDDGREDTYRRLGEIVIDATGDPAIVPFIFVHFLLDKTTHGNRRGVVFIRDPRKSDYGGKFYIDDEADYEILQR